MFVGCSFELKFISCHYEMAEAKANLTTPPLAHRLKLVSVDKFQFLLRIKF
jgi:hypothetical protein